MDKTTMHHGTRAYSRQIDYVVHGAAVGLVATWGFIALVCLS